MAQTPLPPIQFADLAAALLPDAEQLLAKWLPGGKREGHEYKCANLQGGAGGSTSINVTNGRWSDFATGEKGGDLVSLYAAIHSLTMAKAAVQLAREEGLESVAGVQGGRTGPARPAVAAAPPPAAARPREIEGWRSVVPVPSHAPEATFKHPARSHEDIVHVAEYRVDNDLAGYVVRFRTSDGGKETLPYTWCMSARDGACRWHWKTWDGPRPLYFPGHALPNGRTVVLVEGEKKADLLQRVVDAGAAGVYCVVSWPGGCKAWKRSDWSPIAGSSVLAWADCDAKREPLTPAERKAHPDKSAQVVLQQGKPLLPADKQPGLAAMLAIGAHLRDEHGCAVQLLPIPPPLQVPDGWDCADAIATDGWDFARVAALFAQAYALPAAVQTTAPPPKPPDGDGPAGAPPGGRPKELPWWLRPYWDAEKCRFLVSRKLVIAALTHDEVLQGILGLNQLSNNIEARHAWPWATRAGPVTGADDLLLGQYLSEAYGLPSIPRAALIEAIETVAHSRPFHPIREWFATLQWDGKTREEKWLVYAIGETPESLPPPVYEYLCRVGAYWLRGMVRRVMQPGCKFDYCPVLEGPGGLGKSTLVEALAGPEYFSDTHFDVGRGKEGQEQVQGLWMYEIAELANFGKAEIALIKAFISAKVDRYRPSYGRVVESYPRQCVLAGTTNERTYLRDRTGNRRFWPVPVRHRINIPWVTRVREQLFAEAYARYLEGEAFTPSPEEEERLFVPMQDSRMVETAVLSELMHVLTRSPVASGIGAIVNELTPFVTMGQLTLALGVDAAKSTPALEAQIRSWMDHEGWVREKKQMNGARHWGYARPKKWPRPEEDPPADPPSTQAPAQAGAEIKEGADDDDAPF
jgi:putative DNA primase/helicase